MTCDYCEIIEDGIFEKRCGEDEEYEILVEAPEDIMLGDIDTPYIFHLCSTHYPKKEKITWGMVKANHEQLLELGN